MDDIAAVVPGAGSVGEVTGDAVPSLPVPVETPDLPEVPAPVPPPPAPKPPPPSAPSAAEGAARGYSDSAGEGVTRAPPAAAEPGAFPDAAPRSEPDTRVVTRRPDRRSIGPAEAAPLPRWRAYVWPAVALRIGDALTPLLARLERFAAVQVPDVLGLLSPAAVPGFAGNDLPSERSGLLGQNLRSPPVVALSNEGMSLLAALLIWLLMALGLVALARLVVGEELFEVRRWRGHRS